MKKVSIKGKVREMSFEEVYKQFKPMLIKLSSRWTRIREKDDLMQAASIALWKAYEKYDYEKYKTEFITIAYKEVKMRLISFVRDTVPFEEKKNTKIKEIKCLDEKITSSEDGDQTLADVLYSNDDTEKEATDRVLIRDWYSSLTERQKFVMTKHLQEYRSEERRVGKE